MSDEQPHKLPTAGLPVLLTSVFIIATCGILYELLISSISTYFQGSSILQFSLTIGLFMSFMGVGSYASKYFQDHLLDHFITIEILLGLIGGLSAFILYFGYSLTENYYLLAFLLISTLGTGIGLEIPLVTRIVRSYSSLKDTVAQVLSFDYIGALLASIIFPLVLLPYLGTMRTSFLIGVLNLSVAAFNSHVFKDALQNGRKQFQVSVFLAIVLLGGFFYSFRITSFFEQYVYQDEIILTEQSPYQRIVLTKWNQDYRLYINGNLQFSTVDEYRYHEPLVHIPMALVNKPERILILGGGDGLALREVLKYPSVQHIDLVDLDPAMTQLAASHPIFRQLNTQALSNAKVHVFNEDAFTFVKNASQLYSLILIDLPDPNDTGLGKLYAKEFYHMLQKRLTADGLVITQATSPYFAPDAFWCIAHTMEEVFSHVIPFNSYVPSFGQWGFVMAGNALKYDTVSKDAFFGRINSHLFTKEHKNGYRFLTPQLIPGLFVFDKDTEERPTEINTLETQILVTYYEESLQNWE
ncbi:polyamine aminopropyltransferase [Rhodocytophaga aerolata]|uniref:Polyamine aminopropyltransferase n=1 Tax=Rhodocytophaga aerolata TaxID=455078 RepID=A0ABT8R0G0_9BACT|nr:polyamine aminopropyltransferase [Rhodocytophaga aerolata]MDO1445582.1 polyamine aminopropyltransferase [Rhodocytophaga aerolata]